MTNDGLSVVRVLFLNIEPGDRLKFQAKSSISPSGGGARDLRFRPEDEFLPFFQKMFPDRSVKTRKKGTAQIVVFSGTVLWQDAGREKSATMEIWPATNARPNECRIAKIPSFNLYHLIEDDPSGGKSIFMLFQQKDGTVRLYFTTETSLKADNWDPTLKDFAVAWMQEGTRSAFLDLETNVRYPNV